MSLSERGGARQGGCRPSTWHHQPTCTIRIPQVFEATLLEIAKELDQGLQDPLIIDLKSLKVNRQTKKESLNLLKLPIYRHTTGKVVKLDDLVRALQAHLEKK